MSSRYWPLVDLRLVTPTVELRPITEADLEQLTDVLPDDLELDPAATRLALGNTRLERAAVAYQTYWKAMGTWTPQSWALHFVVRVAGVIVGTQVLEGDEFATLRTVDSASWLAPDVRGRGVGRAMRGAVLALAFGPLDARAAVTSAWHDNHASLRVSRALGYQPNGEVLHAREGVGADVMKHLVLRREAWLASGLGDDVTITGFDACRPFFGLPPTA